MSELTVPELDICLRDLVNWQRFAVYLPQIDQTDNYIIEKNNRNDVVDQKLALYETWLKVCPDATWDNVIHALESVKENTLASKIKGKFPIMAQKEQKLKQHEVTDKAKDETRVPVSKDVVAKLQKLHVEFVLLTKEVKAEITRRVENNKKSLKEFVDYIREQKAFSINFQSIETVEEFLERITPHYTFLDCCLIISIATVLLSSIVSHRAKSYNNKIEQFMKETKVIVLRDKLEYFFQNFHSTDQVKVSIALQNAWGKQSIWLVRQLIQQFFGLEHPEQCQWFRIISGSVLLTFLASMNKKCV